MDNKLPDEKTNLMSTMGSVLLSQKEKVDASDTTPTSSTDANSVTPILPLTADDSISSTSLDVSDKNKDKEERKEKNKAMDINKTLLVGDVDLLGMNLSSEPINEDVEDIVQDLENLLGEPNTDNYCLQKYRKERLKLNSSEASNEVKELTSSDTENLSDITLQNITTPLDTEKIVTDAVAREDKNDSVSVTTEKNKEISESFDQHDSSKNVEQLLVSKETTDVEISNENQSVIMKEKEVVLTDSIDTIDEGIQKNTFEEKLSLKTKLEEEFVKEIIANDTENEKNILQMDQIEGEKTEIQLEESTSCALSQKEDSTVLEKELNIITEIQNPIEDEALSIESHDNQNKSPKIKDTVLEVNKNVSPEVTENQLENVGKDVDFESDEKLAKLSKLSNTEEIDAISMKPKVAEDSLIKKPDLILDSVDQSNKNVLDSSAAIYTESVKVPEIKEVESEVLFSNIKETDGKPEKLIESNELEFKQDEIISEHKTEKIISEPKTETSILETTELISEPEKKVEIKTKEESSEPKTTTKLEIQDILKTKTDQEMSELKKTDSPSKPDVQNDILETETGLEMSKPIMTEVMSKLKTEDVLATSTEREISKPKKTEIKSDSKIKEQNLEANTAKEVLEPNTSELTIKPLIQNQNFDENIDKEVSGVKVQEMISETKVHEMISEPEANEEILKDETKEVIKECTEKEIVSKPEVEDIIPDERLAELESQIQTSSEKSENVCKSVESTLNTKDSVINEERSKIVEEEIAVKENVLKTGEYCEEHHLSKTDLQDKAILSVKSSVLQNDNTAEVTQADNVLECEITAKHVSPLEDVLTDQTTTEDVLKQNKELDKESKISENKSKEIVDNKIDSNAPTLKKTTGLENKEMLIKKDGSIFPKITDEEETQSAKKETSSTSSLSSFEIIESSSSPAQERNEKDESTSSLSEVIEIVQKRKFCQETSESDDVTESSNAANAEILTFSEILSTTKKTEKVENESESEVSDNIIPSDFNNSTKDEILVNTVENTNDGSDGIKIKELTEESNSNLLIKDSIHDQTTSAVQYLLDDMSREEVTINITTEKEEATIVSGIGYSSYELQKAVQQIQEINDSPVDIVPINTMECFEEPKIKENYSITSNEDKLSDKNVETETGLNENKSECKILEQNLLKTDIKPEEKVKPLKKLTKPHKEVKDVEPVIEIQTVSLNKDISLKEKVNQISIEEKTDKVIQANEISKSKDKKQTIKGPYVQEELKLSESDDSEDDIKEKLEESKNQCMSNRDDKKAYAAAVREPLSINVEETEKPKVYSPKVTIKPIIKPSEEETSDEGHNKGSLKITITKQSDNMHSILKVCSPNKENKERHLEGEENNPVVPKLVIKPICDQEQHSPKTSTRSSKQSSQRCASPRVTIKPIAKPDITSPVKLTIKPVIKPDDVKPQKHSPKLLIKPIVEQMPKVTIKHIEKTDETRIHSPKITIKPVVKPESEEEVKERIVLKINKGSIPIEKSRKREHEEDKVAKIKVKLAKGSEHAHIIHDYDDKKDSHKRISDEYSETGKSKRLKGDNCENRDLVLLEENQNSPIIISEDSLTQDSVILVSDAKDPLEIPEQPAIPVPPAPRKRGRPRKIPLAVREEMQEIGRQEPVPSVLPSDSEKRTSGRPKRSCRGQSVKDTLGIKPRKPRTPRGGKKSLGTSMKPSKY